MSLVDLFLEDLYLLRNVLAAAAIRCCAAVATAFRDAALPLPTERRVHAQVVSRLACAVAVSDRSVGLTAHERV